MKIGKIVELEDVGSGWSPEHGGASYTDLSGARIFIPERLIVRLYEGLKWHHNNTHSNSWEMRCDAMFDEQPRQGVSNGRSN